MKRIILFLISLVGCLDTAPAEVGGSSSLVELAEPIAAPHTVCPFVICTVGEDEWCHTECQPTASCKASSCDNCGGVCVYLSAQP